MHSLMYRPGTLAGLQFVDDTVERMVRFMPQVTLLMDSLEDKVYFTRRRVSGREGGRGGAACAQLDSAMCMHHPSPHRHHMVRFWKRRTCR